MASGGPLADVNHPPWTTLHAGIFLTALVLIPLCVPPLAWPWHFVLPLVTYLVIALLISPLRRTFPPLPVGRMCGACAASAAVLSTITAAFLVAFQALASPDVAALADAIPVAFFGDLLVAWVCFSVVNAVLEELVFRGVLYEALAAEWGAAVAIIATSACFGLAHLHGYPPGPLGAILAGLYGVCLGLLRWWSGGLGLAVASHVCADATIFGILLWAGAFAKAVQVGQHP